MLIGEMCFRVVNQGRTNKACGVGDKLGREKKAKGASQSRSGARMP